MKTYCMIRIDDTLFVMNKNGEIIPTYELEGMANSLQATLIQMKESNPLEDPMDHALMRKAANILRRSEVVDVNSLSFQNMDGSFIYVATMKGLEHRHEEGCPRGIRVIFDASDDEIDSGWVLVRTTDNLLPELATLDARLPYGFDLVYVIRTEERLAFAICLENLMRDMVSKQVNELEWIERKSVESLFNRLIRMADLGDASDGSQGKFAVLAGHLSSN